jgi:rhodanese-related sulfurtransferase
MVFVKKISYDVLMKKLLTLLLSFFTFTAISATTPKEAYSLAQKGEAVIVDVREQDEIKLGMIKDAKWFPLSKVLNDKKWKEDFVKVADGKTIFLHCRSGKRSEKVLNILKDNGIASENIGGYETLKNILPTTGAKD